MGWDDLNQIQLVGVIALVSGPAFILAAAISRLRKSATRDLLNQITGRWDGLAYSIAGLVMLLRGDELSVFVAVAIVAVSVILAIMEFRRRQGEVEASSNKDDK